MNSEGWGRGSRYPDTKSKQCVYNGKLIISIVSTFPIFLALNLKIVTKSIPSLIVCTFLKPSLQVRKALSSIITRQEYHNTSRNIIFVLAFLWMPFNNYWYMDGIILTLRRFSTKPQINKIFVYNSFKEYLFYIVWNTCSLSFVD